MKLHEGLATFFRKEAIDIYFDRKNKRMPEQHKYSLETYFQDTASKPRQHVLASEVKTSATLLHSAQSPTKRHLL